MQQPILSTEQLAALACVQASLAVMEQHRRAINAAVFSHGLPVRGLACIELGICLAESHTALFEHDVASSKLPLGRAANDADGRERRNRVRAA